MDPPPGNQLLLQSRPSRSRLGCIGCRLRRKKCSEERPSCIGCNRNGLLCTWPDADSSKYTELLRRTNLTHKKSKFPTVGRDEIKKEWDTRSTSPPSSSLQLLDFIDEGDANTSFGIQVLDVLGIIPNTLDPHLLFVNVLLQQPISRKLFEHYLHRTHKIMATCQSTKNPFIFELLPMAISNESTLNALLAFSGIHYADLLGIPVDETTWTHYGLAIQSQKLGLTLLAQGKEEAIVPLLVTAMVLCIIESFRVNSGALALQHLKAARFLLRAALRLPESQLSVETRTFLVERYSYTMILAHITMGPESDAWVLEDSALLFPIMKTDSNRHRGIGSGCVHELFQFIPKVSILARQRYEEEQLCMESWQTVSEYLNLHSVISSWQPPSDEDEVYTTCGKLYQVALLLFLSCSFQDFESSHPHEYSATLQDTSLPRCTYSDLPNEPGYSRPVLRAFSTFISLLNSIPINSPMSTTLCWPLAIFGSCAMSMEHRSIIRQRLNALSSAYGAQNVRDTSHLLEILWHRGERAHPLSFERIMRQEKLTVLFL